MNAQDFQSLFQAFQQKRVLIIGDVMVDAYLWGKVERISPEAPVPIVAVNRRESRLGGAANVALNIKALGAEAILLSVVGQDMRGQEFMKLLQHANLPGLGILQSEQRITTTKFRIIGNTTQLLRVDEEMDHPLEHAEYMSLQNIFDNLLRDFRIDAIIFQDYDKGVITPELIQHVVSSARKKSIPIAVDPKHRNFFAYTGVNLFKPNLKELRDGLKLDEALEGKKLESAVGRLQTKLDADIILVTRSEKGVYIRKRSKVKGVEQHHLPAIIRHIADVSGAGDTVISVATLCLAAGLGAKDIASISNRAGGIVCEQVGVVPIDRDKLLAELLR